jgi:hypothetical protein
MPFALSFLRLSCALCGTECEVWERRVPSKSKKAALIGRESERIQVQSGDRIIQFSSNDAVDPPYKHLTGCGDAAFIQVTADHTHVFAAEIDMQMEIGFAVLGRDAPHKRGNLHWSVICVLMVLVLGDVVETDHDMVGGAEGFYGAKGNLFFFTKVQSEQR